MTIDALDSVLEKSSFDGLPVENFEMEMRALAGILNNIPWISVLCVRLVVDEQTPTPVRRRSTVRFRQITLSPR